MGETTCGPTASRVHSALLGALGSMGGRARLVRGMGVTGEQTGDAEGCPCRGACPGEACWAGRGCDALEGWLDALDATTEGD